MTTTMVLSKLPSEGLLPGSSACTSLPPHCLSNLSSTSPHFTAVLFISLNAAVVLINHSCQTERDQSLCFLLCFFLIQANTCTHTHSTQIFNIQSIWTRLAAVSSSLFSRDNSLHSRIHEAISGNAQLSFCICPLSRFQQRNGPPHKRIYLFVVDEGFPQKPNRAAQLRS